MGGILVFRDPIGIGALAIFVEAYKHYPCVKTRRVEYLGEHPDPGLDRVE